MLTETRFAVPGWAPVPDLVFYRRERLRVCRAPDDLTELPDLAVEIASPEQKRADLMAKCLRFTERGTAVAVLVDPEDEAVMTFRPGRPLTVLQGDDRIDLDDVLPGFELTVRALFAAVNWEWLDEDPAAPEAGTPSDESADRPR